MSERQLVTVREISELVPIVGADVIELAKVDGWQCVVKKGDFNVGDRGIYFEIDSMIPSDDERFEFLSRGQVRTHYRIKTMRLRKALSQGLLMPMSILTAEEFGRSFPPRGAGWDEENLTDVLRVEKYEPSLPAGGTQKGTFPTHLIPKTDQERVQNIPRDIAGRTAGEFEITEKLDGTSCTFYYFNDPTLDTHGDLPNEMTDRVGACSRNWEMKLDDSSVYASIFKELELEQKLRALKRNIAIQGEIIGGNIQGNRYKLVKQTFYVFDIYDIDAKRYLNQWDRIALVSELGLSHVPLVLHKADFPLTLDVVLDFAEDKSTLCDTQREGVVFKEKDGPLTFKAISNKFLLKNNG